MALNCEKKKNGNLNGIDLVKFLMAILVVAIHTRPQDSFNNDFISNIVDSFTSLAVPFFFIASGFLLAHKFNGVYYEKENRLAAVKYLKKNVKLYLIWTAIYLPVGIYAYQKNGYSVIQSIFITIRRILFRGQHENIQILWYLLATIYAAVFILLMMKLKVKPRALAIISYSVVLIIAGLNYLGDYEGALAFPFSLIKQLLQYTIVNGGVLSGIAYIPFGMLLYNSKKIKKYSKYFFVPLFIALFFIKNSYVKSLIAPFEMIGFFSIVADINLKDSKIYRILRESSTYIYLMHMYVFMGLDYILYREKYVTGMVSFFGTTAITIIVSIAYVELKKAWLKKKKS